MYGKTACRKILPFELTNKIKVLGIYFQNGIVAKNTEDNWRGRHEKLNNLIRDWSRRDLSMHGQVVVIQTFLVSQSNFAMQSIGLPETILNKVYIILYNFLWQRKYSNRKAFEKIKRKNPEGDYNEGGLQMINVTDTQKLYYLQWSGKLCNTTIENWSYIPKWHLLILRMDIVSLTLLVDPNMRNKWIQSQISSTSSS